MRLFCLAASLARRGPLFVPYSGAVNAPEVWRSPLFGTISAVNAPQAGPLNKNPLRALRFLPGLEAFPLICLGSFLLETGEDDLVDGGVIPKKRPHLAHGDLRRPFKREAVGTGADGREGDRADAVAGGKLERITIAVGERLVFARGPASPDGTDRMNDVLGREFVAGGDPRFAGRAAAEFAAFLQESGAGRIVDRSIDATR
jgi:hypothetical protein